MKYEGRRQASPFFRGSLAMLLRESFADVLTVTIVILNLTFDRNDCIYDVVSRYHLRVVE